MELLAFILISIGIIIVPGPNVLTIVSTSIVHGKLRGLQTVAGTSSAMAIQLGVAAVGAAWLTTVLAEGFTWLKWIGVVYLVYLGIGHVITAMRGNTGPAEITGTGSFRRGFWVSLTNPKTILFFGAFIPQFTVESGPYLAQIAMLSIIFLVLATLLDGAYALLSSHATSAINNRMLPRYQHLASGFVLLGAAIAASRFSKHA